MKLSLCLRTFGLGVHLGSFYFVLEIVKNRARIPSIYRFGALLVLYRWLLFSDFEFLMREWRKRPSK